MKTVFDRWKEAKGSKDPLKNIQDLIANHLVTSDSSGVDLEMVAINKLQGNIFRWSCNNLVQYYDNENIWKILSMMIGKMSQLKSELPKKSAENFMRATTKLFQNLTIVLNGSTPHKVMEACTNVLQHIFLERRIQYRPTFSSFSHDLSSILNAYNGNILGIELMEMSTNCTKLVIVLLSLLNNLIYEQASRKKLFSIFVSNLMGPLMQLQSHHSSPIAVSHFKISQSRKITFLMKKIFGNAVFSHAEIQSYPSAFGTIKDFKDTNINPEKKEKMSKTKKKIVPPPVSYVVQLIQKVHEAGFNWDLSFLYKLFLRALAPNIEKVKSKKDLSEITINFQFFVELYHTYHVWGKVQGDESVTGDYLPQRLCQQDKLLRCMLESTTSYVYNEQDVDRPQFNILRHYCAKHIDAFRTHASILTADAICDSNFGIQHFADIVKYEVSILTNFIKINHELINSDEVLSIFSSLLLQINVFAQLCPNLADDSYYDVILVAINFASEMLRIYAELRQLDVILQKFLNVPSVFYSFKIKAPTAKDKGVFSSLFFSSMFLEKLGKHFAMCLPAKLPSLWEILVNHFKNNYNKNSKQEFAVAKLASRFLSILCSTGSIAANNSLKLSNDALVLMSDLLDDYTVVEGRKRSKVSQTGNFLIFEVFDSVVLLCQRAYRFLPKEEDQFRILGKESMRSSHLITIETCKKISNFVKPVVQNVLKTAIESEDEISEKKNIIMKILMRLIYMYHSAKEDYSVAIINENEEVGKRYASYKSEHEFCKQELKLLSNSLLKIYLSTDRHTKKTDVNRESSKLVFDNLLLVLDYCEDEVVVELAKCWIQRFFRCVGSEDELGYASYIAANVFEASRLQYCIMNEILAKLKNMVNSASIGQISPPNKKRRLTDYKRPTCHLLFMLLRTLPQEYILIEFAPKYLQLSAKILSQTSVKSELRRMIISTMCKLLTIMNNKDLASIRIPNIETLFDLNDAGEEPLEWLRILVTRILAIIVLEDESSLRKKSEALYINIYSKICDKMNELASQNNYKSENQKLFDALFYCNNIFLEKRVLAKIITVRNEDDSGVNEEIPDLESLLDSSLQKKEEDFRYVTNAIQRSIVKMDRVIYSMCENNAEYNQSQYKALSHILHYHEIMTKCTEHGTDYKISTYEPSSLKFVPKALSLLLNDVSCGNKCKKVFLTTITSSIGRFLGVDSNVFISVFEKCLTVACLATESQEFDAHFLEKTIKSLCTGYQNNDCQYVYERMLNILLRPISSLRSATPYMRALEVLLSSSEETWKYDIVSQHLPSILKLVSVYNDNIIFRATRDFKEADGQESNVSFNGTADMFKVLVVLCKRNRKILISSSMCTCVLYSLHKNVALWGCMDKNPEALAIYHENFVNYVKSGYELIMTLLQFRSKAVYRCAGRLISLLNDLLHQHFVVFNNIMDENRNVENLKDTDSNDYVLRQRAKDHFYTSMRYLRRIYEELANHTSVFRHFVPYLLSPIFAEMKQHGITAWTSDEDLKEGLFFLFSMCSEHETRQIHAAEDSVGRSFFTKFFDDYKTSKYSGLV